ncbi:LOB domain-containing protein 25-like [Abrus precatorius]|uniref:LOB domain-containing protein 25-like n=1 Tax=Abrus precatorius TaxID=3816 RepID=A0A8B8LK93_ABRPR|nr:LOB domain-containing protein 25-like [Abrus precatorius]
MNDENRGNYPCLICKQHRRRHDHSCIFGQYFPINRTVDFENASMLFGLSNLLRIMQDVDPQDRQHAADSILREGTTWINDIHHGPLGYVLNLRSQIQSCERQLENVNRLLAYCRDQANSTVQMGISPFAGSSAFHLPQQNTQLGDSSIQFPNLGGTEFFSSSHEKGESSTIASKEKEDVDEEKESMVDDKGKNITSDKDANV